MNIVLSGAAKIWLGVQKQPFVPVKRGPFRGGIRGVEDAGASHFLTRKAFEEPLTRSASKSGRAVPALLVLLASCHRSTEWLGRSWIRSDAL
jgi:hypothetical protein